MRENNLLDKPCRFMPGVGEKLAEKLAKLNIFTVQDLLFHLPYRYQDRTRITAISDVMAGAWTVVEGIIVQQQLKQGRRTSLICYLQDKSAWIKLRFFHGTQYFARDLIEGVRLRCFGEVRNTPAGLEMIHPELTFINDDKPVPVAEHLTPIYAATAGVSQVKIRQLISNSLEIFNVEKNNHELLANQLLNDCNFPDLKYALNYLHRPPPDASIELLIAWQHPTQKRLIIEELLAHYLSMQRLRHHNAKLQAPIIQADNQALDLLKAQLPFQLTQAQLKVSQQISDNLTRNFPMRRLVQGDVGSGKTIVAALAALQVVKAGFQVAIMAPTELLAEQHLRNFVQWLMPLDINVGGLLGKVTGKKRQQILTDIKQHQVHVIIGTHALFQAEVEFAKLGLVIIDEQHRFGVSQRLDLVAKGNKQDFWPHQLIMTATPIPRTLAMIHYADLDISIIDELPPGRIPVNTAVIPNSKREMIIARLRTAFTEKKQAYWVCTLIDESEKLQSQAAEETFKFLAECLPEFNIGLIHGRLKAQEKEQIMLEFKAGNIDLLVATTVIEVGVDVPNASLMIIENPERLGLFQLHQLRGRVGRGAQQSYCILLYQTPLSYTARQRLQILRDSNDGFEIARKDLYLRGAGEIIGTKQTGNIQYKIANFERDQHLFTTAREFAHKYLVDNHEHNNKLIQRWLGSKEKFSTT